MSNEIKYNLQNICTNNQCNNRLNLKEGNYRFFVQLKIKESQKIVSKQFDFSIN